MGAHMSENSGPVAENQMNQELDLKMLQACDIAAIDRALAEIGPFGEVHLVVEDSRLRFIRTVRSEPVISALKPKSKGK